MSHALPEWTGDTAILRELQSTLAGQVVLRDRFPTPFVQHARLSPGQLLLLYSDGVSESLRSFRGRLPGAGEAAALAREVVAQCGRDVDDAACAAVRLA